MVGRFVIPTDDHGQYGCHCLARIIPLRMKAYSQVGQTRCLLVKVAHSLVLLRHGHCSEIMVIANGLKIPTNQEQIYFVLLLGL